MFLNEKIKKSKKLIVKDLKCREFGINLLEISS